MTLIDRLTGALGAAGHTLMRLKRRGLARVIETELHIPDLATSFDGYVIVALSDFHQPPSGDLGWLSHAVDCTNAARPDLVVLLGDYGSSFRRAPQSSAAWYHDALPRMTLALQRIEARDGVVAILGNHDYYAGVSFVREWLSDLRAHLLVNEPRHIQRGGSGIRVAGLDDVTRGTVDPRAGCVLSERTPTLLLCHNPDGVLQVHPNLRVDLMLAGHTHGGQIVIPAYGAPITMSRTCGRQSASGWIQNSRATLYVTRGLGQQLPLPVRVNCPPELLVVRLSSDNQQPA